MDPVLTSSQADPEHVGQNWDHKHVRKHTGSRASYNMVNTKCNTYCLKTSLTRLVITRGGFKLLYHGNFMTPGQLNSSGVPQSSNIFVSCSGCITKTENNKVHIYKYELQNGTNGCRSVNHNYNYNEKKTMFGSTLVMEMIAETDFFLVCEWLQKLIGHAYY
jgi:hypothetical protein